MKLEMAQKGPLRAAFRVGAIHKGKGYRQSGEDLKPRTDQVSFRLCCDWDMEWEMKRRHKDQLGALSMLRPRMSKAMGVAVDMGRRVTGDF